MYFARMVSSRLAVFRLRERIPLRNDGNLASQNAPGPIGLDRQADLTIKSLLGALVTIVRTVAELRGQFGTGHGGPPGAARPPRSVAQLAVSAATAFGVFAWERHRELADAEVPDPRFRTDGYSPTG